jgi:diguanylate cyclase
VNKNLVVLHLGDGPPTGALATAGAPSVSADAPDPGPPAASDFESEATLLRTTLDGAFETLSDVLTSTDDGGLSDVTPTVGRVRQELAAGGDAEAVDPLARTCFDSVRNAAADARTRSTERRSQIASILLIVRETVSALSGDQQTYHQRLDGSVERFARLAKCADIEQIQSELVREVAKLRQLTVERRAAWDRTVEDFGTRLTSLETQLERTRREASVDPLTNVGNRRTFERTCREWVRPNGPSFVMAVADVDDFKAINDKHGHAVGDRVLITVAMAMAKSLRPTDLVARIGGDEFAVLASGLTLEQAERRFATIADAVQKACRELPDSIALSISIGIAECSAGDTLESLHHRADSALYQAKRAGKGRLASKASPLIRDLMKGR